MRVPVLIVLGYCLMCINVQAQDSAATNLRDQLEETFEDSDLEESQSAEQLIQFLQELENNPVNVNRADLSELLQIPGVSLITASSIITYRENQPFTKIEDVKKVRGIGEITYRKMQPYITVRDDQSRLNDLYRLDYWVSGSKMEVISRFQQNLESQSGYRIPDSTGGYTGNSVKYYQRLRFTSDHLSVNLTQEKDAGEALESPTDFDFNSMHLALLNNGRLKKLVIGDYSLSFGQGLVIWSGGAFGKGREVIKSVGKNERGLRPYTSAQETNYFRGIAATYGDQTEVTFFYSITPRTASEVGVDSTRFPSSSGFHRTQNEINRKHNLDQETIGGRIRLNTKVGLIGLTSQISSFNSTIVSGNTVSDRYDFSGTSNAAVGLDYRLLVGRSLVFGEIARSDNSGYAGLIGLESSVGNATDIAISYRNYCAEYLSILGDGFGERSGLPQNEEGFYVGLRHSLNRLTMSGYFDQYVFDAPIGNQTNGSRGVDALGMMEFKLNRSLSGYVLFRNEEKEDVFELLNETGRIIQLTGKEVRTSVRAQVQHQPIRNFRSRTRVEWIRYEASQESAEYGFLIFQDIRFIATPNWVIDARFTLFDTDSFNSRLYQFENDLRFVLTNVALSDQGQRWYLNMSYKLSSQFEISAKLSQTIIEDAAALSSGLNQIEGNTRTFLGLQARWLSE